MPKNTASPKGANKTKTSDQSLLKTGWASLQTSPDSMNGVLKNVGASGVIVKELFEHPSRTSSFDSLRALMFLYKWRPDRGDKVRWNPSKAPDSFAGGKTLEDDSGNYTERIMFCNQLVSNASSTQALIVTLLNIPEKDDNEFKLGSDLAQLKHFLLPLDPVLRTSVINDSDFVRNAHNQTAEQISPRKLSHSDIDAKSPDTVLASEFWHYTIFLPDYVSGNVYEMDGMGAEVASLGFVSDSDDTWANITIDPLEERVAELRGHDAPFHLFGIFDASDELNRKSSRRGKKRNGYQAEDSENDSRDISEDRSNKRRKTKADHRRYHVESEAEQAERTIQAHDYTTFLLEMTKLMASRGDIMRCIKRTMKEDEAEEDASDNPGLEQGETDGEEDGEAVESVEVESDLRDSRLSNGYPRERDFSDRSGDYGSMEAQVKDSTSLDDRRRSHSSDDEDEIEIEVEEEASASGSLDGGSTDEE